MSKVLFIGSKAIGLRSLEIIHSLDPESIVGIMTLDDSKDERNALDGFRSYAKKSGLRLDVVKNRSEADEVVKSLAPDICLVVGWYWLIKQEILDRVPKGFLGIHHSLLPKYRGSSPLVWSIINGDPQVGTTLFSFTEGMDDGPIWAQKAVDVSDSDDIGTLLQKLDLEVENILNQHWLGIINGTNHSRLPDLGQSTFCVRRHPHHGQIDWTTSAQEVFNFIRAQTTPYPGAYTGVGSEKLIVWKSQITDNQSDKAPGAVSIIETGQVQITCGYGSVLELLEAGFSSEDRRSARDVFTDTGIHFTQFLEK